MPLDLLSILTAALLAAIIAGLTTNLLVPAVAQIATVLRALEAHGVRSAILEAVQAAAARSKELGA